MLCLNKLPSYFYDLISQDSAISRTVIGKLRNKHAQLQLHWIKGIESFWVNCFATHNIIFNFRTAFV